MNRVSWIFLLAAVGVIVSLWAIEDRSDTAHEKQLLEVGTLLRESQVESCERVNDLRAEFNERGSRIADAITDIRLVLLATLREASADPGNTESRQEYSRLLKTLRDIETASLARSVQVPTCNEVIPDPENLVAHLTAR